MDTQMDYQEANTSFDLVEGLQQLQDEYMPVAISGPQPGQGLPSPGTPVPLIGRMAMMSQADVPPVGGQGGDRGVKRKYCSSNSASLTSSAERQIFMQLNMFNSSESFPDAGGLTEDDFNSQIESPDMETVLSPPGVCSISSTSTQSSMLHSPNTCSPIMENHLPPSMKEINDSATRTEQITIPETETTSSNSGMPSDCKLELKVGYTDKKQKTLSIDRPDGFILFHEKTPDTSKLPKDCTFIRFPDPDEDDNKNNDGESDTVHPLLDEKHKKYVKVILQNMWGGLQVRCHNGCIYATRWSKAKIYYKSYETRSSRNKEQMVDVLELPRGREQMVFNLLEFEARIGEEYKKKLQSQARLIYRSDPTREDRELAQEMNPTIYFSIAQKWAPDCNPLKSCLVWAQLQPCRALFEYDGLFHTKHNSLDSFHSNLLQLSIDPVSLEGQGTSTQRGS